jgi:hypothetical protein
VKFDRAEQMKTKAALKDSSVAGFSVQQFYLQNRYRTPSSTGLLPSALSAIFAWAQHVNDGRIAVVGPYAMLQYGLYGRDDTNYVQYIGQVEPHGGYAAVTSCERWRQALNAGHYDYVVTSTGLVSSLKGIPDSSFTLWTSADPASTVILREIHSDHSDNNRSNEYNGFFVFRLHGTLSLTTCSPRDLEKGVLSPA